MAKKYLQIQIPTPCSEDFSKMTPAERGRFCNNCEKVVIDFSKMSDQEIANFYKNNNGKICGRFHHSQLNRDIRLTPPKVNSIFGKAAGLILTGVLSAGATNVAAQNIEITPPTSVVDSETETENKESEKEKIIRFKVVENSLDEVKEVVIGGAKVTHLESKTSSITNEEGIVEIRLQEYFFNEKKINFSISHDSFIAKELELDFDKINNEFYEVELKSNLEYLTIDLLNIEDLWMGYVVTVESDYLSTIHPHVQKFNNTEKVKYFDFEIEKSSIEENITLSQLSNSKKSDSREEKDPILLPLGVAIKSIFPNPFIDKINLEISVEKAGLIHINLVDIAGRVVFQKEEQAEKGTQQFQIEVGNLSLSGNMYILQVQDESGNVQSQQLMRYTNHGFTMR